MDAKHGQKKYIKVQKPSHTNECTEEDGVSVPEGSKH